MIRASVFFCSFISMRIKKYEQKGKVKGAKYKIFLILDSKVLGKKAIIRM